MLVAWQSLRQVRRPLILLFLGAVSLHLVLSCGSRATSTLIKDHNQAVAVLGRKSRALLQDVFILAELGANGVTAWGSDKNGQLKVHRYARNNTKKIAAGTDWALALSFDGDLIGWGSNSQSAASVPPYARHGISAMSAGDKHGLAVKNGRVLVWGGQANANYTNVPQTAMSGIIDVAAGYTVSMAITAEGDIIGWGDDANGQLKVPPAVKGNVVSLSVSNSECMAILKDGSAIAWGNTLTGALEASPDITPGSVSAVAAGNKFGLVLLRDGRILHFGNTANDVASVPPDVQGNAMAISAKDHTAAAISRDGQIFVWGRNGKGETGPIPQEAVGRKFTAISCGKEFTMALTAGDSKAKSLSKGAIAGIAIGSIMAVLLCIALVVLVIVRRARSSSSAVPPLMTDEALAQPSEHGDEAVGSVGGYCWISGKELMANTAVEAGVNDTQLDKMMQHTATDNEPYCPVVALTGPQVKQQILLLTDGLLGTGATAAVFKCLWPTRFGDCLLAAKVLKDTADMDQRVLDSFYYEASVLASINHPNIVRMYGYCMEPPTVCLILELLPTDLKHILHRNVYNTTTFSGLANYPSSSGPVSVRTQPSVLTSANSGIVKVTDIRSSHTNDTATTTSKSALSVGGGGGGGDALASDQQTSHSLQPTTSENVSVVAILQPQMTTSTQATHQHHISMLQVLQYANDIACGLAYLHSVRAPSEHGHSVKPLAIFPSDDVNEAEDQAVGKRIVHRDLKPANIMINSRGTAKISDFGLARQHQNTTVHTGNVGAGTLPYQAPELLVGMKIGIDARQITNRVDVYSMAMIMWEMLSGQPPWQGMNAASILQEVSQSRRPDLPSGRQLPTTRSVSKSGVINELETVPSNLPHNEPQVCSEPIDASMPASLVAVPEFNAVIRACWNQRALRRPTAAEVHAMLAALLSRAQMGTNLPQISENH